MTVAEQLHLLLVYSRDAAGRSYSANQIALGTGLSVQATLNLLQGDASNPRLDTMRRLCRFFQISLDYFGLDTVEACEAYLQRCQVETGTPLVRAIQAQADELSPLAAANVLVLMSWAERGTV